MSSKGTAHEIIHATHDLKRGMVYSDNLQENRNYQKMYIPKSNYQIVRNTITW